MTGRRKTSIVLGASVLAAGMLMAAWSWQPLLAHRYLARARSALHRREYALALDQLRQAERLRPRHAAIQFWLARTYRHLGNGERFVESLAAARRLGFEERLLEQEQWLRQAQAGQLQAAHPHLSELLTGSATDQREACEAYVRGYLANLRLAHAQELLTAWQRDFPDDAEAWMLQATLHELASADAAAVEAYRRAAALAPHRIDIKLRLGERLTDLRDLAEAERWLAECLAAEPADPQVVLAWARMLQEGGKLAEARQALESLQKLAPEHSEGRILLGEVLLSLREFAAAEREFQAVLLERPNDAAIHYLLAKAMLGQGRAEEAEPHLNLVAASQKPLAELDLHIADALQRPDDVPLRVTIGSTLWQYGSPDDAARWMRNVLELDPSQPDAHRVLADYYQLRGESELAAGHRARSRPEGTP